MTPGLRMRRIVHISITSLMDISAYEATRQYQDQQILRIAFAGLFISVEELEASHSEAVTHWQQAKIGLRNRRGGEAALHQRVIDHDQLVLPAQAGELLMQYAGGDELCAIEGQLVVRQVKPLRHRGLGIGTDQQHALAGLRGQNSNEIPGEGRLPTPRLLLASAIT